MRSFVIPLVSASLLAVTAAPTSAHVHKLTVTVPGTEGTQCTQLGSEPTHVHDTLHPIHNRLHKGPGAPADSSTVVDGGDPVQVGAGDC